MSVDLAVWEGRRPASEEEALQLYERLADEADAAADQGLENPPTPAIDAFVSDLLARWPDLDEPGGENSPWAVSGLREEACGGFFCLCMTNTPVVDEVTAYAAALGRKHGLVVFDPQTYQVLS